MRRWFKRGDLAVICDPGIDDLLALRLLEKLRGEKTAVIEAAYGNMPLSVTCKNAQAYAAVSDYGWSVIRDETAAPLGCDWIDAKQGSDGLWGTTSDMSLSEVNDIANADLENLILSLGTLGPVKRRVLAGPGKRILIMGGVFERLKENGNDSELNIRLDQQSARWVFDNADKADIWLVPADVAFGTAWSRETVESIPERDTINRWLKKVLLTNFDTGRYKFENELYDPLAVLLGFRPELATWKRCGVEVSDDGRTIYSDEKPDVWIAVDIPNRDLVAKIAFELLFEERKS